MPDNRLPTNQSQLDIVSKLDEIKDAIAQGGGGGGTGGHTIIDENGTSMTARSGLQFVGGANVSDDPTNNKTIVDLASAGGIDGVFIDTDNVIQASTLITSSADVSYTATEDCTVLFAIASDSNNSANIKINDIVIWEQFDTNGINQFSNYLFVKKGQTVKFHHTFTGSTGSYTVYGIQTGTNPSIPDYSTTEHKTGRKWIDGKDIWEKSFYSASSMSAHTEITHGISNLDLVIRCECCIRTSNKSYQLPITTNQGVAEVDITPTNIDIDLSSQYVSIRATGGYLVTIQYTKSS